MRKRVCLKLPIFICYMQLYHMTLDKFAILPILNCIAKNIFVEVFKVKRFRIQYISRKKGICGIF